MFSGHSFSKAHLESAYCEDDGGVHLKTKDAKATGAEVSSYIWKVFHEVTPTGNAKAFISSLREIGEGTLPALSTSVVAC